jgi:hypothetical protein
MTLPYSFGVAGPDYCAAITRSIFATVNGW